MKQTVFLMVGLMAFNAIGEEPATKATATAAPVALEAKPQPATNYLPTKDQLSYALGLNVGNSIKRNAADVNVEVFTTALRDVLEGKPTRITEREATDVVRSWHKAAQVKAEQQRKETGIKNKEAGDAFMAKNAKEPGVVVLTNGLQYVVQKAGDGPIPAATDTVEVNYRGTLIDGTEFDSSYSRNQPFTTTVTGVIKGWQQVLQMMKVGSKWKVFIPPDIAYGQWGSGAKIGPNMTLIFEMELLSIKAAHNDATNEVVSGDIIKVPSAEDLKKGAKIEVIKASDTNALIKAAGTNGIK